MTQIASLIPVCLRDPSQLSAHPVPKFQVPSLKCLQSQPVSFVLQIIQRDSVQITLQKDRLNSISLWQCFQLTLGLLQNFEDQKRHLLPQSQQRVDFLEIERQDQLSSEGSLTLFERTQNQCVNHSFALPLD